MGIKLQVKTRFFISFILMGFFAATLAQDPDNEVTKMASVLSEPEATVSIPDIRSQFENTNESIRIDISLESSLLKMYLGELQVLSCQVTCGRTKHSTPKGEYTVTGRQEEFGNINYGSYVDPSGFSIMRGVYPHLDPMPANASFSPSKTFYGLQTNKGILLHSGFITPFPSSDGSIILPLNAAQLLFQLVPDKTKITIK